MTPNIFISWSEERSRAAAKLLRDWIPHVLQRAQVFMSDEDVPAGRQWLNALDEGMRESSVGILCVTPENAAAPWLVFEAGVISARMKDACVIPLLIDMKPADLRPPLSQFQSMAADLRGVWDVVSAVNRLGEPPLPEAVVNKTFDKFWPEAEEALKEISAKRPTGVRHASRSQEEILGEILQIVRGLDASAKASVEVRHAATAYRGDKEKPKSEAESMLEKAVAALSGAGSDADRKAGALETLLSRKRAGASRPLLGALGAPPKPPLGASNENTRQ